MVEQKNSYKVIRKNSFSVILVVGICIFFFFCSLNLFAEGDQEPKERQENETIEIDMTEKVIISEIMLKNDSLLQADDSSFPGWIELANVGNVPVNLSGWNLSFYQSDGFNWTLPKFPDLIINPGEFKLLVFIPSAATISIPAIRITTQLSDLVEKVELINNEMSVANSFTVPPLDPVVVSDPPVRNIAFIRDPQFLPSIRITENPTPGMENGSDIPTPEFVLESGFYDKPKLDFKDIASLEDWDIRYTINDGLEFDEDGHLIGERDWIYPTNLEGIVFNQPVTLEKTSVVKARYYSPTGSCSKEVVKTYFVGEDTELPVFSITTNPADLWDTNVGIYTIGDDYEKPNFVEKRFRIATVEFFQNSSKQTPNFVSSYLIRTYGDTSKYFPQKSFVLYAKKPGSNERIPNLFFNSGSAKDIPDFYSIVLRNSGGDTARTFFRDGLMTTLATGYNIDKQDFQPAVVFLNGQYWGILNIREKINEYFIEDHYEVNPDNIDLVEGMFEDTVTINEGLATSFSDTKIFVYNNDAKYDEIYQEFEKIFDIENIIDYFIFQSFYNNLDWPWSNVKFWRSPDTEGRWRWLMYDTDEGFDTIGYWTKHSEQLSGTVDFNTLELILGNTEKDGLFSVTFRNLMRNSDFYFKFFSRYDELLNTVFTTNNLRLAIDNCSLMINEEMERHISRWNELNPYTGNTWSRSVNDWKDEINILYSFAEFRPDYVKSHIEQFKDIHPPLGSLRIVGGNFEQNLDDWDLGWTPDNVEQDIIINDDGNIGHIRILHEKEDFWDSVAFVHDSIYVSQGEEISFTFDIRANRPMVEGEQVKIILFDPETLDTVFSYTFQPGVDWEKMIIETEYTKPTLYDGRLQFRVGKLTQGQELFIDNIYLEIRE